MKRLTTLPMLCIAVSFAGLFAPHAGAEPNNANITPATQAIVSAPLSERFVKADAKDVPDFQRHVVPLMGRLGCNGRACHGSFQGRGGFQLSLFGYDFKGDHQALLDEQSGRVDVDDIEESLILSKPTDADLHEGGKRYDTGSWQHHVLRRWIESGAKFAADDKLQKLTRLEIQPAEIQFQQHDQSVQLKAFAHWESGIVEDVTELCRFSSNDDAIAAIDRGRTHHLWRTRRYARRCLLRQSRRSGPRLATGWTTADRTKQTDPADRSIGASRSSTSWASSRPIVAPTPNSFAASSLDITGILPEAHRVREFLADQSPDKRAKLVDDLLDSPGYGAWWATRFSDWTGNSEAQLNNVLPLRGAATRVWHEWLRTRLDQNVPYDEIIEGIVEANSRNEGESYLEYCKSMTDACQPGNEELFAKREGLPLFWARRNFAKPEDRAIGFAYAFLGVRIECAQCHKHPFDQWSKNDFDEFAKLFGVMRYNQNQVANDAKQERDALLEKLTGGKELKGGDLRKALYAAGVKAKSCRLVSCWSTHVA